MDPIKSLIRSGHTGLTPAEEDALLGEISAAYHHDEAASLDRDIRRIAEKICFRMRGEAASDPSRGDSPSAGSPAPSSTNSNQQD